MQARLSTTLEIVSVIAVIVSLLFVGFEIRNSTNQNEQDTRALQVSAHQDLMSRSVDLNAIGFDQSITVETLIAMESPTTTQSGGNL